MNVSRKIIRRAVKELKRGNYKPANIINRHSPKVWVKYSEKMLVEK